MTHDELREKLARALAITAGYYYDDGSLVFEPYLADASTALSVIYEALREPTMEMMFHFAGIEETVLSHAKRHAERAAYRAMLDASPLKETK